MAEQWTESSAVLLDSRVDEIVQFGAGGSKKEEANSGLWLRAPENSQQKKNGAGGSRKDNSNDANGGRWKEQVAVGRLADSGEWLRSLPTEWQHNVHRVVVISKTIRK